MATKTFNNWKEHGWWIVATNTETPMLWLIERVLQDGQFWATFGHEHGKLHSVTTTPQDIIFFTIAMEEGKQGRFKFNKKFMMALILPCCLNVHQSMQGLPRLQKNWTSMPDALQSTCSEVVERF